jgi:hypothetical protein
MTVSGKGIALSMSDVDSDTIPHGEKSGSRSAADAPPEPPSSLPRMLVEGDADPLDLEPDLVLPFIRLY